MWAVTLFDLWYIPGLFFMRYFIKEHPEQPDLGNCLAEIFKPDRLNNIGVCPQLVTFFYIRVFPG
jgi:hypothetical protein